MTELLAFAHTLADAAAAVTTRYFGHPCVADHKADGSPVTRADREAEAAMRRLIEAQFPDHGILGEEHGQTQEGAPRSWVLDPVDGTRAFLCGYPTFATLIAYVEHAAPQLGVVDQPVLAQRFVGVRGQGSSCNGVPLHTSRVTALAEARVATTSTDYFSAPQRQWFDACVARAQACVRGGDAYAYAMLAAGRLDAVVDVGMQWYDVAALLPLVEGAGGALRLTRDPRGYTLVAAATVELLAQLTLPDPGVAL